MRIKRTIVNNCILRALFYRDIKIGDNFVFVPYAFDEDVKNPFKKITKHIVRVIDSRGGYIKYEDEYTSVVDSMSISSFAFCYRPLNIGCE